MITATRRLLLAGFGGLLALMAFAGLDTLQVLRAIQDRNDSIRGQFLNRNRLLDRIRTDLYLSGTYVRDYLLEPDSEKADSHRYSLAKARADMQSALREYAAVTETSEQKPFSILQQELAQYWQLLQPVMRWAPAERHIHGYPFLRDEVYPRRTAMLGLADQIGELNEQQLGNGNLQISDLFGSVRRRLGLTLCVTLVLGAILAVYSVRRLLRLERESVARYGDIAQARTELKQLSARLVEAQENERRTISRELHDEVGQSLSALMIGLGNLASSVTRGQTEGLGAQIGDLRKLAGSAVGVVRNMTLLLRPSMLDDLGLVPALQWQAREVSRRSGVDIDLASAELADDLPDEHKTAVYRVVQEALHNCEKHSGAKEVRVILRQQQDALLLSIQDNGCGFDARTEKGLGLRGMRERIENLGGMLNVESESGRGSLITVRLPLHANRL